MEDIIYYSDSTEADRFLMHWNEIYPSIQESGYDQREIQSLIIKLKITAFPLLSDEESEDVLKSHLLEFFDIEAPLEPLITEKLFLYSYPVRKEVREGLKRAILSNNQMLGDLPVGQWIQEFDKKYDFRARSSSSVIDFINTNPTASKMNAASRYKLKKILHAYDYLLVYTLTETEPELSQMIGMGLLEPEEKTASSQQFYNLPAREENHAETSQIIKMPFSDSLKDYPELGEQVITSDKIKIKYFNDFVRPSIKNWLSDYTANLGYYNHTSMERGNYLFQSENTKNLGFEDRQRLSLILKSFDEGTPLTIDVNAKQILFSELSPSKKPEANKIPIPSGQTAPASKINYNFPSKPQDYDFQQSYRPRTQEPGNNFEKVIQLEDKEEASSISDAPRVVNLKEPAREKPPAQPVPQPKNLLNIKDLVEQSRKEREQSALNLHEFAVPANIEKSHFKNTPNFPIKSEIKGSVNGNNMHSENDLDARNRDFHESLDETEKNLFQKNNDLDSQNMQFSSPQKMPYEKIKEKPEISDKPEISEPPKAQPYRIHPSEF